jgi:hypothetical protein
MDCDLSTKVNYLSNISRIMVYDINSQNLKYVNFKNWVLKKLFIIPTCTKCWKARDGNESFIRNTRVHDCHVFYTAFFSGTRLHLVITMFSLVSIARKITCLCTATIIDNGLQYFVSNEILDVSFWCGNAVSTQELCPDVGGSGDLQTQNTNCFSAVSVCAWRE